jgi:hypothetical protein
LNDGGAASAGDVRRIIINDLKIIAQAEEEQIGIILTEDANTLSRVAARLRERTASAVRALLLTDGFTPGKLQNPDQGELNIPSAS